MRGPTRSCGVEQHRAFAEERRVGRVQIFRLLPAVERTAAEGDHPAPQIGDGEDQPGPEAVVGDGDVLAGHQHAHGDHVVQRNALRGQMLF